MANEHGAQDLKSLKMPDWLGGFGSTEAKRNFRQWKNCCLRGDCPSLEPCMNEDCIKKCDDKCKKEKPKVVVAAVGIAVFGYVVGLGVGYMIHRLRATKSATSFSEFFNLARLFG